MSARIAAFWLAALAIAPLPAAEDVVLHVMVFDPSGVLKEAWRTTEELAREFEAEHAGVRVKLLAEGTGDVLAKLKIMLAARQPLDVAAIDVVEFSSFLEDGILLDLEPYFERDSGWNPEEYFEVTLDAFRDRRGHLYGLPSTFTPYVMYYNQDLFDRAGAPYPREDWTWEEFLAIAERLTDRQAEPKIYGVSITQWLQALAPWIWQNGGTFLSADASRCTVNEERAVEAFRFLARLFHEHRVASTDATYEGQVTRGLFQDGRVALYGPVGYWETNRFMHIRDFRWDVCPLPRNREAVTSVAMRSYVGFSYTKHPELAYRFIRKLAGARLSHTLARIGNGVPGLREAAYSEDFLKPDVAPESEQVFLDVLPHARFLPIFANWRELESIVREELQGCLIFNKFDAETACERMAEKVDAFLAREAAERARPTVSLTWLALAVGLVCAAAIVVFLWIRGREPSRLRRKEARAAAGFVALWGLGFLVFTLGPMIASLGISLTIWSPVRPADDARWAGIDNYTRLATDDGFVKALEVTTLFAGLSVPLTLIAALGLALLVRRGHGIARTVFYTPVIVSAVAVGVIWRWILDSPLVEALLGARWIESEAWIIPGFVAMSLWSVGGPMLVFLAGLQGIDPTLYEASRLDGASRWRQFWHVTLPQLTPVLLFNLIIGVINAFQTFAQPYVMTDGGPGDASLFYVLYLFKTAFRFHNMGYASALGWVLFLLLLVLTVLLLRSARGWVHYEGGER